MATICDYISDEEEEDIIDDYTSEEEEEEGDVGHAPSPDFVGLGRNIQNRSLRILGSMANEARRFKEFFGTSVLVGKILWEMLDENNLLPKNGEQTHLLLFL